LFIRLFSIGKSGKFIRGFVVKYIKASNFSKNIPK
jgi:hypothetical protein